MEHGELIQGRSRVYTLFGHLLEYGVTEEVLPVLWEVPELAQHIAAVFDADEAAADYQELFGFNVFPYVSVFLEVNRLVGGEITNRLYDFFRMAGFGLSLTDESADHVSHSFAFLAYLSAYELEAMETGNYPELERVRSLQARFMDELLFWWLLPFVRAIEQQPYPFFRSLGRLILEFVLEHRRQLGELSGPMDVPPLADVPSLEEPHVGLREIARYLTTPVWTGLFLSRGDIARLARKKQLPRGFGSREMLLENLLRSAVRYDALEELLDNLEALIQESEAFYESLPSDVPSVHPVVDFWLRRLGRTREHLHRIREAALAAEEDGEEPPDARRIERGAQPEAEE